MDGGGVFTFLDVDRAILEGDPFDRSALGAPLQVQLLFAAQFCFLRRESVTVDRRLRSPPNRFNKSEIGQGSSFFEEILVRKRGKPKVFPPDGFFLPTMPIQDISQDPSRLLLGRAFAHLRWDIGGQARNERVDADLPLCAGVARFGRRRNGAFDDVALYDQLRPYVLEPVTQCVRRKTVVAVVAANHGLELVSHCRRIGGFEKRLYGSQRTARIFKRGGSSEPEEALQFLDRVALDARADALPDDVIEIDEDPCTQQTVDFFFTRGVTAHEAFQGTGFVGGVVVNVQIGEFLPTGHYEVGELGKRGFLLFAR